MLKLYFSSGPNFELLKTEFSHSAIIESKLSIRGKDKGAFLLAGTFQWTQAVQALSLFFLKAILATEETILVGEIGSPAASLEYALAKPPVWLVEMFGLSKNSKPFIKKLVKRTNPELKRPGPVELSLNDNLLKKEQIEIYLSKKRVEEELEIMQLVKYLENAWKMSGKIVFKNKVKENQIVAKDNFLLKLKELYAREISSMLFITDIFSNSAQKKTFQRVLRNLSIPGYGFKIKNLMNLDEDNFNCSQRWGAVTPDVKRAVENIEKLRVALPVGSAPTLAIMKYISLFRKCPIEIDYNFQYAIEIVRKTIKRDFIAMPDLILLGIAPAATYLNQPGGDYTPLMIMPGMSHRMLRAAGNKDDNFKPSEIFMLAEEFSTSIIYYELLKLTGKFHAKSKLTHVDPGQVSEVLKNGDTHNKAISFFPFYNLSALYQNCTYCDQVESDLNITEFVLFIHNSHLGNEQLINTLRILIRDAWLSLREQGDEFRAVLNNIFADKEYLRMLKRFSGLASSDHSAAASLNLKAM